MWFNMKSSFFFCSRQIVSMLFTSIAKLTPEVRRTDVIGSLFRALRRGLGHTDVFRVVLFCGAQKSLAMFFA